MKKYLFISILFIVGCAPSRELLQTTSINTNSTEKGFIYENDTVKVTYWFWGENGIMQMKIYNKLNVPIFIDWKVSNYINNDVNLQYWYDVQNATSTSVGVNYYGLRTTITGIPASTNKQVTNTSIERPDRITSITPHSEIKKAIYCLMRQNKRIDTGSYTADNSPIKFRSFIALSANEENTKKFYIDNSFYVSHATIIKEDKFEIPVSDGHGNWNITYPYKNPTYFYSNAIKQ